MKYAAVGPIAVHLPETVETNEDLALANPQWDMPTIYSKTGVRKRHLAAANECSSDLGVCAAEKLFAEYDIDPASIDYLLFCTQTPDYPLPTTACLMQHRLKLRTQIGAIDFNQGCSGFVYGLSLADGLIRTGAVRRCLLITAETYSRFISPQDRSLRTIFGDGAAATLVEAVEEPTLSEFRFGTDGRGADTLMVTNGGFRPAEDAHQPRHRHRWPSQLYMDGPSLISFSVSAIPELVDEIMESVRLTMDDVGLLLLHQATRKMLELMQDRLGVGDTRLPIMLDDVGNTVSSTLPILIRQMREAGRLDRQKHNLLIGFGVGWSWAGCLWRDVLGGPAG